MRRSEQDEQNRLVQSQSYHEEPWAKCQALMFILMSAVCDLQFFGFNLISTQLNQMYGVSMSLNFWFSSAFLVVPLVVSIPVGMISSKFPIKRTLGITIAVSLIGTWLKVLINSSFYFAFIGQYFVACSYPLFRVNTTKLSTEWFNISNRTLVTAILSLGNNVISIVSMFLPTLAVNQDNIRTHQVAHFKHRLSNFLAIYAIIGTLISVLCFIAFKNKPTHLTSPSSRLGRLSLRNAFGKIISNTSLIITIISGTLSAGVTVAFQVIVEAAFRKYGASTIQIRWYTIMSIPFTIIVSLILSYYSGKKGIFKLILVGLQFATFLSFLVILLLFKLKEPAIFGVIFIIAGVTFSSIAPIGLEMFIELSFPVPEPLPIGIFFFSFKLCTLILVQLSSGFIINNHIYTLLLLFVLLDLLALILLLLVKEKLHRRAIDLYQPVPANGSSSSEQEAID